jgi:hypothetical protein
MIRWDKHNDNGKPSYHSGGTGPTVPPSVNSASTCVWQRISLPRATCLIKRLESQWMIVGNEICVGLFERLLGILLDLGVRQADLLG